MKLSAPFPYFGGKKRVAAEVWRRFGNVPNYVEPFFGSGAVLLQRPHLPSLETVNDYDGLVSNFWRAVQQAPGETAAWADWPVNENDLHARHAWLVGQKESLQSRLEGDPDYYDAKVAGWWVWGMACWIGGAFCSGEGPWVVDEETGQLVRQDSGGTGTGVRRQRIHLSGEQGVRRQRADIYGWFESLSERLRRVRVCCGDWSRVLGPTPTWGLGLTGVFLDPPYSHAERDNQLYRRDEDVGAAVREWCLENGDNPLLRIALCGYDGEHELPGWSQHHWHAAGGYALLGQGRGRENREREVIWFSPHCLQGDQQGRLWA